MRNLNWFQARYLAMRGRLIRRALYNTSFYFFYRRGIWYLSQGYYQDPAAASVVLSAQFTSSHFRAADWTDEPVGTVTEIPGVRPPPGGGWGTGGDIDFLYALAAGLPIDDPRTPQTITFSPDPLPNRELYAGAWAPATASSGLAVEYDSSPLYSTGGATFTPLVSSQMTVTARQAGNATYRNAAPVSRQVTITESRAYQTITFSPSSIPVKGLSSPAFYPAISSSGLAVVYTSSNTAVATGGSIVTIIGVGFCTITATQAGSALFQPAQPDSRALTVAALVFILKDSDSSTLYSSALLSQSLALDEAAALSIPLTGARMNFNILGFTITSASLASSVWTGVYSNCSFASSNMASAQFGGTHSICTFTSCVFTSAAVSTGDCSACGFDSANFTSSTCSTSATRFLACTFTSANFTSVVWSAAYFQGCNFTSANFTTANLACTFIGCNFTNCNFLNAVGTGSTFIGCTFTGATKTGSVNIP